MRKLMTLSLLAASVSVTSVLVAGASATASTTAVTFTGSVMLPTGTGTGTVVVEAEQGHNKLDPPVLTDTPVASETIRSGTFAVTVPESAILARSEVHGWVPFVIIVESGEDVTVQNISVPVAAKAADGNAVVSHELGAHSVSLPAFSPFYPSGASSNIPASPQIVPPQCEWKRYGGEKERTVRIGQIHLTKLRGLKMAWDYGSEADTTMTIGYSESPASGWTSAGSYTATNSIGSDSGFSVSDKLDLRYIDGQAYFQRYRRSGLCPGKPYKNQLDHMVGNSWVASTGKNHKIHPKVNPYHGCLSSDDPDGNAMVHAQSHFDSDRSKASTLTGAAGAFGFTFSESTGFTSSVHHDYVNNSHQTVYLCGKGFMPDVPIIYNNKV